MLLPYRADIYFPPVDLRADHAALGWMRTELSWEKVLLLLLFSSAWLSLPRIFLFFFSFCLFNFSLTEVDSVGTLWVSLNHRVALNKVHVGLTSGVLMVEDQLCGLEGIPTDWGRGSLVRIYTVLGSFQQSRNNFGLQVACKSWMEGTGTVPIMKAPVSMWK